MSHLHEFLYKWEGGNSHSACVTLGGIFIANLPGQYAVITPISQLSMLSLGNVSNVIKFIRSRVANQFMASGSNFPLHCCLSAKSHVTPSTGGNTTVVWQQLFR